jgi:p24 family protein beta-1
MRLLLAIVVLFGLLASTLAHSILLLPHEQLCFYEELKRDDKLSITFQVGDGGHLDVDFWVSERS